MTTVHDQSPMHHPLRASILVIFIFMQPPEANSQPQQAAVLRCLDQPE